MEHEHVSAVEELTDNNECCSGCYCDGECHCNHEKMELPEIYDESDIDRIIDNLNDWD